jgi:hypothetical protein
LRGIDCIVRMTEMPGDEVRNGLQPLGAGLESGIGDCRNCGESGQIYRARPVLRYDSPGILTHLPIGLTPNTTMARMARWADLTSPNL